MERISKALQRARGQRDAYTMAFAGASAPARPEPEPPIPHKNAYTRTRVVDIARERMASQRVVAGYDPCMFTDAFKILAIQVSQRLNESGWNTVAVTSPNEHEGKTLVAVNLAISIAMEFQRTALLVDADLRRPKVAQTLGLPRGGGLSDYLVSAMPLEDVLVNPGIDGLVVLPGGTPLLDSSELMGSRQMAELVKELKARYRSRVVVFDLPPLLSAADVLAFAPNVDAALLVVEEGRTHHEDVLRAADLLSATRVIGTVLNKSSELRVPADKEYRLIDPPPGWRAGRSA